MPALRSLTKPLIRRSRSHVSWWVDDHRVSHRHRFGAEVRSKRARSATSRRPVVRDCLTALDPDRLPNRLPLAAPRDARHAPPGNRRASGVDRRPRGWRAGRPPVTPTYHAFSNVSVEASSMRRATVPDTSLRPAAEDSDPYRTNTRRIPVSPGGVGKRTVMILLASSLLSMPCPTFAQPAPSITQDVSPVSTTGTDSEAALASDDAAAPEPWNLHGQLTFVKQYHPSFTSPYQGTNSLHPGSNGEETTDLTLFAGAFDSGMAARLDRSRDRSGFRPQRHDRRRGFSSGEAYKVGEAALFSPAAGVRSPADRSRRRD